MDSKILKMIVVLSFTGVLVGGVLASVYKVAEPLIEANRLRELREAIFLVLPGARDYETIKKEGITIYKGVDENGNSVGFSFVADGPGFQGRIKMMVGINVDLIRLKGMKVLEQIETPGLGNKIADDEFQDQFKGLSFKPKIVYIKNRKPDKPNQIQAITGATISSKAVAETINKEIKSVLSVLTGEV